MPIYNRGDAAWLRTGVTARIVYGYILPTVNVNSAQIGTDGATWLWCNLRSQLARLILYRQIPNWQPRIILRWKNVWMYTNLLRKNVRMLMNIHMKNVNDVYFDTNISINMRMKVNVMLIFIYIELRIVYLYHVYCYLHHLCAWWCRCICIWICRWI